MKISIFCVLSLFLLNPLFSQGIDTEFRHITDKNGLSQNSGNVIIQDYQGFIWIGTDEGINRFDGYTFKIYRKYTDSIPNSISSNIITDIFEDKDKNLWIATKNGLSLYNRSKDNFINFASGDTSKGLLGNLCILKVFQDSKGNLWIGTLGSGLALFNKSDSTFTTFPSDPNDSKSLSNGDVNELFEDSKGNFWVGTTDGLNLFDYKTRTFRRFLNSSKERFVNNVRRIVEDDKGGLFLGTLAGVHSFEVSTGKFSRIINQDLKNEDVALVSSMLKTLDGKIWVGIENKGLFLLDREKRMLSKKLLTANDYSDLNISNITSIYEDSIGTIWLGARGEGIYYKNFKLDRFKNFVKKFDGSGLSNDKIKALYVDGRQRLWIGTDGGGLIKYNIENGKFLYHNANANNDSLNSAVITTLTGDTSNIWIGTYDGGLNVLNLKTRRFSQLKPTNTGIGEKFRNFITATCQDRTGKVWTCVNGLGFGFFDLNTGKYISHREGISSGYVNWVFEDSQRELWVATGWGLNKFDKITKKFKTYLHDKNIKSTISDNFVQSIYEDSKKRLWIGTRDGLNLYNRQTESFQVFKMEDALPNNHIQSIIEDGDGNLWIGTFKGLCKFNYDHKKYSNYSTEDGLPGNEFSINAVAKDQNGILYFGTMSGVTSFDPVNLKTTKFVSPIRLTNFSIFNTPVKLGPNSPLKQNITEAKEIVLDYKQTIFSFEFACLDFLNPAKINYAYKMEGFDTDWNYVNNNRTATYTNLNPGKYTFRVKASNRDGIWNEEGIFISLVIEPPYWLTLWFQGLMLCLFFAATYGFYRWKINNIKRQKELLEAQVEERTFEINEQKHELETQTDVLKEAYSEIRIQKDKVEYLFSEMKSSIRVAQDLQQSLLPDPTDFTNIFPENFILYKSKDNVSGDFYWFGEKDGNYIVAVVDCTGHGVSGAIMAINGHYLLNKAIERTSDLNASSMLNNLNSEIFKELHLKDSENRNGMDISLCIFSAAGELQFAAANHQLYIVRDHEVLITKGDRFPIGVTGSDEIKRFTNHVIPVEQGDMIYMFTDGYFDQLGGEGGESKLLPYRFRELLLKIAPERATDQLTNLESTHKDWQGENEQTDDILIIGFRI